MLEVFHGSQDVEHRALLHPVREAKELSGDGTELACLLGHCALFWEDVNHTLG